ncbi:MAG: ABC transporter permease subunit [Candidatus Pacebacteria bacterium]|nr:ABC transporter permease subunit [Candidatus Paceibacterota bacterium]
MQKPKISVYSYNKHDKYQGGAMGLDPSKFNVNDRKFRAVMAQVITLLVVVGFAAYLVHNTLVNLEAKHIQTGFSYLSDASGISIGESLIPYESSYSWGYVVLVGSLNTLQVAITSIILCTIFGVILGLGRLSTNFFVARSSTAIVEGLRNLPLALQLIVWYAVLGNALPDWSAAWQPIHGLLLSKGGISFPSPVASTALVGLWIGLATAILVSIVWWRIAKGIHRQTSRELPVFWPSLAALILLPLIGKAFGGWQMDWSFPTVTEGSLEGGFGLSSELLALTIGLSIYTATYVAEVVRAGIQSVSFGQTEAARALGLSKGKIVRLVVLPQAMRVIIPPTLNQYLNVTKNSSLAYLVGYPDLVSLVYTGINQTGQAIEGIAVMMAIFLTISLVVSLLLNWLNARSQLVSR